MVVLDATGRVAGGFDPLPPGARGPDLRDVPGHWRRELARLVPDPPAGRATPGLRLPGHDLAAAPGGGAAGVRALLTFTNEHDARAPVVEATPVPPEEWAALACPDGAARTIEAGRLAKLLAPLYPPAMMMQNDTIERIEGTLRVAPDPARPRTVVAAGDVTLTLGARTTPPARRQPGPVGEPATFGGALRLAVTRDERGRVVDLVGTFEGSYERPDRRDGRRTSGIRAALESLPRP